MITAIVTAHRKTHKLASTLQSLDGLGNITDRIVVGTGYNAKDLKAVERLCKKHKARLLDQQNNPSHVAWLAGAMEVKTPAVVLLHDGDVLSPEFSNIEYCPTQREIIISQAKNLTDGWIHKELCVEGFPTDPKDIKRVTRAYGTKSLSPGRAVVSTDLLQKALAHYNTEIFTPSLLYGESLAIGNDLTLWHYISMCNAAVIKYVKTPLIAFDTEDSTTARADAGHGHKLEPYYDRVRDRLSLLRPEEKLNILYNPSGKPWGMVTNFNTLNFPLPTIDMPKNNTFGTASFMTALEYAWCMGYDWMHYFEEDCKFPNGIDAYVYHSLSRMELGKHSPIMYGTPTIWNAQGPGRYYYKGWKALAKSYTDATGIELREHGTMSDRPAIYVNGALGIYNVREIYAMLIRDAKRDMNLVTPWDLQIGYRMHDRFREGAFSRIVPDTKQYSDGDLIYYPTSARSNPNILAWHK